MRAWKQKYRSARSTLGALLVVILASSPASVMAIELPASASLSSLYGLTQNYDVLLRGNGDTVVNASIGISNRNTQTVKSLHFSVPNGSLGDVTAFQEISCSGLPTLYRGPVPSSSTTSSYTNYTRYAATTDVPECYPEFFDETATASSPSSAASNLNRTTAGSSALTTTIYPTSLYPPTYGQVYEQLTVKKNGTSIDLELASSIAKNRVGTVVMFYTLHGITQKYPGGYTYDFRTLKSATPTSTVVVSVATDEDYYLDGGAKGKIDYKPAKSSSDFGGNFNTSGAASMGVEGDVNAQYYVDSIGENGSLTKTASKLAANETFAVEGSYASNWFSLHLKRNVIIAVVVLLGLVGLVWSYIRRKKRLERQQRLSQVLNELETEDGKKSNASSSASATAGAADNTAKPVFIQNGMIDTRALPFYGIASSLHRRFQERRVRPLFFAWLCGLLTILLVGLLLGGLYLGSTLSEAYYYTETTSLLYLLSICVIILMSGTGILGFIVFSLVLPYVYAGSVRKALRIYMHLFLFLLMLTILVGVGTIRLADKEADAVNNTTSCSGYECY